MSLDRRLNAVRSDLADARLRGRVDAPRFAEGVTKRVIDPVAALRREPSPASGLDTQALMGEAVSVFEEDVEGWAWVQLERDGYVGYLPSAALGDAPEPSHRIAVQRTFVYPGPSLKLPTETFLSLGSGVTVERTEGQYARIAVGWVVSDHLDRIGECEPDFVAVAERFLHTPYLWGGKTSLGIDCSGLVQVSMQAAGLDAPRDSDMQERALGTPIAFDERMAALERGDLVFWKGHVGIMLDADTLLHANGYHMAVAMEPIRQACARILAKSFGAVTAVRRPERLGAGE